MRKDTVLAALRTEPEVDEVLPIEGCPQERRRHTCAAEGRVRVLLAVEVRHLVVVLERRHAVVVERDERSRVLERRPDDVLNARGLRGIRHRLGVPHLGHRREVDPEERDAERAVCAGERGFDAGRILEIGLHDLDVGQRSERLRRVRTCVARDRARAEAAVGVGRDRANESAALRTGGAHNCDDLGIWHVCLLLRDAAHIQSQPPSTVRLMPLTAPFSSRKRRRVHDLGHRHEPSDRRALDEGLVSLLGHVAPLRAVADDRGVERIHAPRGELDHERPDEARHRAVDRRDRGRARIGTVAGEAAEHENRRVVAEPRQECVDDLGVPDELERHQSQRRREVVVPHRVAVALDRREDEVLDVADVGELVRDRLRFRQVEAEAAGRAADLRGDGCGAGRVAAGDHDVATLPGVEQRNLAAETLRPADDDNAPHQCECARGLLRCPLGQQTHPAREWNCATPRASARSTSCRRRRAARCA